MPHRYDASTKYLLEMRLADWLPLSGRATTTQVRIVDADVSTVTAAADRVLLVEDGDPWILHVELQSGRDLLLPARTQMYNTHMEESVTYQAIVEEGRLREARQMLLDVGAEQLGEPTDDIRQAIGGITDLDHLRRLGRRLLHVSTWQELLAAT